MRIAILDRDRESKEYREKELAANELTGDGRHVLRNLLDQLRSELDELDYQEREDER